MSWFAREKETPRGGGQAAVVPPATVTVIAKGSLFEGRLTGATEVRVEGELAGEVHLNGALSVGEGGIVRAPIVARWVRIAGRVVGRVEAAERVEVLPSGSLEGDVSAPRVTVAEGAFVKGKVEMGASSIGAAAVQAPAPVAKDGSTPRDDQRLFDD